MTCRLRDRLPGRPPVPAPALPSSRGALLLTGYRERRAPALAAWLCRAGLVYALAGRLAWGILDAFATEPVPHFARKDP